MLVYVPNEWPLWIIFLGCLKKPSFDLLSEIWGVSAIATPSTSSSSFPPATLLRSQRCLRQSLQRDQTYQDWERILLQSTDLKERLRTLSQKRCYCQLEMRLQGNKGIFTPSPISGTSITINLPRILLIRWKLH